MRIIFCGLYPVGYMLWVIYCGLYTVGGILWDVYTVGGILWVIYCGLNTVGGILWEVCGGIHRINCGRYTVDITFIYTVGYITFI